MARGWESKSVEAQIEAASVQGSFSEEQLTRQEYEQVREKEGLLLSRTRILNDLKNAQNPRYQKILRDALAHVEGQLAKFG